MKQVTLMPFSPAIWLLLFCVIFSCHIVNLIRDFSFYDCKYLFYYSYYFASFCCFFVFKAFTKLHHALSWGDVSDNEFFGVLIILVSKCAKCSVCNSINFQGRTTDVLASLIKLLTNTGATGIHYCAINVISGMTKAESGFHNASKGTVFDN